MSFRSVVAKNVVVRMAGVMTVAGAALVLVNLTNESFIRAQSPRSAAPLNLRLPDETTGVDAIARTLISAFDQVDIVALGEAHGRFRLDSELRIAMVRHPDFAKKVRSIVVEFGSTSEQSTLDRYIRGENVSRAQLEQVWKTTTQTPNGIWDQPIYAEFFAAVRDVNSKLPADARVRVFGGDPGPGDNRSRETAAVSVLKEQVLQKHGKALVIYGAASRRTLASRPPSRKPRHNSDQVRSPCDMPRALRQERSAGVRPAIFSDSSFAPSPNLSQRERRRAQA
jgi:hypothetical protein